MKKLSVHFLLLTLLLGVVNLQCGSAGSLLSAGSPLMSSLGGVPNLSSVTNLLKTPGLDKILKGSMKKPFTLLAPTNDALGALGSDAMSKLADPKNVNQLAGLLKDQIVPGKLDENSIRQPGLKSAGGKAFDLGNAKLGSLITGEKFNILPIDMVLGSVTNAKP